MENFIFCAVKWCNVIPRKRVFNEIVNNICNILLEWYSIPAVLYLPLKFNKSAW